MVASRLNGCQIIFVRTEWLPPLKMTQLCYAYVDRGSNSTKVAMYKRVGLAPVAIAVASRHNLLA